MTDVGDRWPLALAARASRAQGRRTLTKILDAAVVELGAAGFHGARMSRIAKAAEVAHGTVYVYFSGKEDLLVVLQQDVDAELSAALTAMPALVDDDRGMESLGTWMQASCAVFQRHGAVLEALAEVLNDDERHVAGRAALRSMSKSTGHIAARIAATGAPGIDAEIASLCVFAVLEGLNRALFRGDLRLGPDEVAAEIAVFVQRSVFGGTGADGCLRPGVGTVKACSPPTLSEPG